MSAGVQTIAEVDGGFTSGPQVRDWQSEYQSAAVPIPRFPPSDDASVNFMGRLTRELLRQTAPNRTMYLFPLSGWFDTEGKEVVGIRMFAMLKDSVRALRGGLQHTTRDRKPPKSHPCKRSRLPRLFFVFRVCVFVAAERTQRLANRTESSHDPGALPSYRTPHSRRRSADHPECTPLWVYRTEGLPCRSADHEAAPQTSPHTNAHEP